MGPLRNPNDNPQGGNGFGPSQLAGAPGPGPDDTTSPGIGSTPDAQGNALQIVVEQVRTMEQSVMALAQQFPAAAPEARRAVDAIRSLLQRIVSTPTQPESQAPVALA